MKNKYFIIPLLIFILTGCGKKELVCLNGYTLNEKEETCERRVEEQAKQNYYCEGKDSLLDGNQCRIVEKVPAVEIKSCENGYHLDNGRCIKDNTIYNNSKCDNRNTYSEMLDNCFIIKDPNTVFSCNEGQLEGSYCSKVTYEKAKIEFICEDHNYKLEGDKCVYFITMKAKDNKADY